MLDFRRPKNISTNFKCNALAQRIGVLTALGVRPVRAPFVYAHNAVHYGCLVRLRVIIYFSLGVYHSHNKIICLGGVALVINCAGAAQGMVLVLRTKQEIGTTKEVIRTL